MITKVLHSSKSLRRHMFLRWPVTVLLLLTVIPVAWASPAAEAAKQAVVETKGMSCPFCAYGIKKHLLQLPGAKKVEVDLAQDQATVDFAPDSQVTDEQIKKAVRDAGFKPGKIEWRNSGSAQQTDSSAQSGQNLTTTAFAVEGIRCTYCAANITSSLEKQPGVKSAQVDWQKKIASVTYDPQKTNSKEIIQTIEKAGKFHARQVSGLTTEAPKQ